MTRVGRYLDRAGCLLDLTLDLTYVVTWILCAFLWSLAIVYLDEIGILPESQAVVLGLFSVFLLAILATVSIWFLRNKRRSLWWSLLLFLPFGWLFLLLLRNRNGGGL